MTDKLIAEAIGKLDGQNIAHGRLAGVQMHRAIGIGRLEPGVTDQLGAVLSLFDAIDDHLCALAHMGRRGGKTERLGQIHGSWARSSLTSSSTWPSILAARLPSSRE